MVRRQHCRRHVLFQMARRAADLAALPSSSGVSTMKKERRHWNWSIQSEKLFSMVEQIAAAAIRVGQEVYTGPRHFKATIKIIQMRGLDPGMIAEMLLDGVDGFVTNEGRFVNLPSARLMRALANTVPGTGSSQEARQRPRHLHPKGAILVPTTRCHLQPRG